MYDSSALGETVSYSVMCLLHFPYRKNASYKVYSRHMEMHAFSGGREEQWREGGGGVCVCVWREQGGVNSAAAR